MDAQRTEMTQFMAKWEDWRQSYQSYDNCQGFHNDDEGFECAAPTPTNQEMSGLSNFLKHHTNCGSIPPENRSRSGGVDAFSRYGRPYKLGPYRQSPYMMFDRPRQRPLLRYRPRPRYGHVHVIEPLAPVSEERYVMMLQWIKGSDVRIEAKYVTITTGWLCRIIDRNVWLEDTVSYFYKF
ncbi:hypothetical protein OWV82_010728 [Melia azedarach]|uniref:Uncharacterized protein n=1 Tax=Melia azedarach TaxID=155640 RepID=A0ACC1Y6L9_MELAZ|nr:hypothetical protein OWV82_010728 [Melia azedarach]